VEEAGTRIFSVRKTSTNTIINLGAAASQISFFAGAAAARQAAIPNAALGTEIATINSILTVLRNYNLIAT
jgi:hypothetical protein